MLFKTYTNYYISTSICMLNVICFHSTTVFHIGDIMTVLNFMSIYNEVTVSLDDSISYRSRTLNDSISYRSLNRVYRYILNDSISYRRRIHPIYQCHIFMTIDSVRMEPIIVLFSLVYIRAQILDIITNIVI